MIQPDKKQVVDRREIILPQICAIQSKNKQFAEMKNFLKKTFVGRKFGTTHCDIGLIEFIPNKKHTDIKYSEALKKTNLKLMEENMQQKTEIEDLKEKFKQVYDNLDNLQKQMENLKKRKADDENDQKKRKKRKTE